MKIGHRMTTLSVQVSESYDVAVKVEKKLWEQMKLRGHVLCEAKQPYAIRVEVPFHAAANALDLIREVCEGI
jgi:hypothetical protein